MYKYYNPHPNGKRVGDCVKRAFTLATGWDYRDVSITLNRIKRELNQTKYNDNKVWREFVKRQKWGKISFPAIKGQRRMDGFQFTNQFKEGTYVLRMAKHLVTVVDGVLYDSWDSRAKCVYVAWKVK